MADEDVYGFGEAETRRIADATRWVEQHKRRQRPPQPRTPPVFPRDPNPWERCKNNNSSLVIPAYGLVRPVSADASGILTVDRPDEDDQFVYVNSAKDIAISSALTEGRCTLYAPIWALYETGDGTPADGEEWGAGVDSYKLRKNNTGFIIHGGSHTAGRVLVRRSL